MAKKGGIALIDRSIIGDMTFARMQKDNGNFTEEEWQKKFLVMDKIRDRIPVHDQKKLEMEISRAVREVRAEKKQNGHKT